jgi:hypothetical protein
MKGVPFKEVSGQPYPASPSTIGESCKNEKTQNMSDIESEIEDTENQDNVLDVTVPENEDAAPEPSEPSSLDSLVEAAPALEMFCVLNRVIEPPKPIVTRKDGIGRTIEAHGMVEHSSCVFHNPA